MKNLPAMAIDGNDNVIITNGVKTYIFNGASW